MFKRIYVKSWLKKILLWILIYLNVYFVSINMKSIESALLIIPLCLMCTYVPFLFEEEN